MNVSQDILDKNYDRRTEDNKTELLREFISNVDRYRQTYQTNSENIYYYYRRLSVTLTQDKTGQIQYEQVLTELHTVASELSESDSQVEICKRTIDAAEHLLQFDLCVIALEEDGLLYPKAVSSDLSPDKFDVMSIHEGIAGKTYRTGESFVVEDITGWDEAKPQGSWVSGISLPLGEHGNFQAVDTTVDSFDEQDLQLATLLVTHTTNHLDRLAAKQELERQNERLEEFASIISHDLRNPLNVAELRLELAREDCESEHIADIERAHNRMKVLTEDLLTLARGEHTEIDRESVDLAAIAENSWLTVDTHDASLVTDMERATIADTNRLKQMLENLFRNAVEHGGEDVTVTVGELDNGFYIEDNGNGIPEDERDSIFDSGYSTATGSTGFGLRIVKQIADAHNWNMRVTDGRDGGARFEITDVAFADQ